MTAESGRRPAPRGWPRALPAAAGSARGRSVGSPASIEMKKASSVTALEALGVEQRVVVPRQPGQDQHAEDRARAAPPSTPHSKVIGTKAGQLKNGLPLITSG